MPAFSIDHQTFKDLNVFEENVNSSLYSLFKNTRTLGAREELRAMMQNPSNDISFLELRRDSIKYFYSNKIDLAIKNEEIDLIEFYLKSDKRLSKSNIIDSVADYLTKNSSNDYYIIKTGLKYLIKLTKYLLTFIELHSSTTPPLYLAKIFKHIQRIINDGLLKQALAYDENKLSFYQVNRLDNAFRGREKENLNLLVKYVYELDIFENISTVAHKLNLSFPEYNTSDKFQVDLQGLFHTGIKNPVKNNININEDQSITFLTGSNMAGKSSLLKSIGIAIYLSHLGFPVPADKMRTTLFNGLITTINLADDLNNGLSHYYNEVKRVKEVALRLAENDKIFVIFDELFRGTNVKDAYDASLLIISALASVKNSAFFISTHIVELAAELQKIENISFKYMETFFNHNEPTFTYQMADGISKERLGMFIILKEGIVEILKQAK